MINPSLLQQLGRRRQSEILEASRTPRVPVAAGPGLRQRLGWSLIGLGVHLALNGRLFDSRPWSHVPVGEAAPPLGRVARS